MKIGVVGAAGRMGGAVIRQVSETAGCTVVAAIEAAGNAAVGRDAGTLAGIGALGVTVTDDANRLFAEAEAVIEFSSPEATVAHARIAAEAGCIHIIGTTGLDSGHQAALQAAGASTAIVHAPNMSLAVNILISLTRQVAALLDDDFDIEIVEMHHRHKVDAPSGTALGLGRAAASGRGVALDQVAQMTREGRMRRAPRGRFSSCRS